MALIKWILLLLFVIVSTACQRSEGLMEIRWKNVNGEEIIEYVPSETVNKYKMNFIRDGQTSERADLR